MTDVQEGHDSQNSNGYEGTGNEQEENSLGNLAPQEDGFNFHVLSYPSVFIGYPYVVPIVGPDDVIMADTAG